MPTATSELTRTARAAGRGKQEHAHSWRAVVTPASAPVHALPANPKSRALRRELNAVLAETSGRHRHADLDLHFVPQVCAARCLLVVPLRAGRCVGRRPLVDGRPIVELCTGAGVGHPIGRRAVGCRRRVVGWRRIVAWRWVADRRGHVGRAAPVFLLLVPGPPRARRSHISGAWRRAPTPAGARRHRSGLATALPVVARPPGAGPASPAGVASARLAGAGRPDARPASAGTTATRLAAAGRPEIASRTAANPDPGSCSHLPRPGDAHKPGNALSASRAPGARARHSRSGRGSAIRRRPAAADGSPRSGLARPRARPVRARPGRKSVTWPSANWRMGARPLRVPRGWWPWSCRVGPSPARS